MSPARHDRHPRTAFDDSRVRARQERAEQRSQAVRTVAGQARDREEFTGLLSMLGLDDGPAESPLLLPALAAYARQVAVEVGVPADAVGYEVSDTATAYLGLTERSGAHPSRDLMLVWDERTGWSVAVETVPGEPPFATCHLGGDAVPVPAAVAEFVAAVVAGRHTDRVGLVQQPLNRSTLTQRVVAACVKAR